MRNAMRIVTSTMGALAGGSGAVHGLGEALQGNRAPDGLMFPSWPGSPFFDILGGEPAMTLIPNFLVAGLLTMLVSLIVVVWAIGFVPRQHGGLVLILLSIVLLLVGGGFGPPLLGLVVGLAGTRIRAPLTERRAHVSDGWRHGLGSWWPWFFGACLLAWLSVFPGLSILSYFFGVNDANLVGVVLLLAAGFLLLTIVAGSAHDSRVPSGSLDERAGA